MNQSKTHNSHVQAWLEQLQKDGKSASTIKAYQRALHHLARWSQTTYGETFDPTQVIAPDVRDWKSCQQSVEKAAPTTINQRLVAVSSFYKWAVAMDLPRPWMIWPSGWSARKRHLEDVAPHGRRARPMTWPRPSLLPLQNEFK